MVSRSGRFMKKQSGRWANEGTIESRIFGLYITVPFPNTPKQYKPTDSLAHHLRGLVYLIQGDKEYTGANFDKQDNSNGDDWLIEPT